MCQVVTFPIQLPTPSHVDETENDQSVPPGRSKALRTKVKIVTNADGEPDIPSITLEDGYAAKAVQTTLRDYCNTHIRELRLYSMDFCITSVSQGTSLEEKM